MRYLGIIGAAATIVLASGTASADVVTDWNETAVDVGRKLALGPNAASRLVAITQIAVFEAVNSVGKEYDPYHAYITPPGPVDLDVVVAQAAHDVLLALAPTQATYLDDELALSLEDKADGPEKENAIELGFLSASSIFVRRLSDGASASVSYPGSEDLGKWRPTPRVPEFTDAPTNTVLNPPLAASDPQWGDVVPFALLSADQFRAPAPPDITSVAFADAFNEVKTIGIGVGSTRTEDQTEIAKFWAQQTHIPFNDVARTVAKRKHLTLTENAHLFAVLNIALADARIATWDSKYNYGYWRPITAIRSADVDGNDGTELDATWNSLLDTPNHPEYVSGHSATGAAGAAVLAAFFGDETGFAVHSDTLKNVTRGFDTFSAAAAENAESRVLGGIHYRFSNEAGLALGAAVAAYDVEHTLLEVPPPVDPGAGGAGGEGGEAGSPSAGAGNEGGTGQGGTPSSGGVPAVAGTSGTSGIAGTSAGTSANSGSGGKSGTGGTSAKGGKGGKGGSGGKSGSTAKGGKGGTGNSEGGESGEPATTGGKAGKGGKGGAGGKKSTPAAASDEDDSGCGCSVPHENHASFAPWLAGLALLSFRSRRQARLRARG